MLKSFRQVSVVNRHLVRCYSGACMTSAPCDPAVNVTFLQNGIRVATEYKPSPLTCISLYVEAGPRFETAHMNGISHLLEHMAYKGFCGMPKCEFEHSLLQMGAKMTVNTTRELQTFTGVFPSEYYAQMVDNLAGVVTNLELNEAEIAAEKYNICLEMVDEDNDQRSVVFDYLHQSAFQGTPLAQRVMGPTKNVTRFDRETLRTFYCQHYQPYKFTISTCGAVRHEHILELVCRRLGHLVGNPGFESSDGPTRFTGSQLLYRDDSMPFAHVALAFEAPGYGHPDYLKCLLASHMVGKWHKSQGGGYKNASPTAQAAAVDDFCDSYESFYITYRDVGLWGVYYVSKRMDIEDMLENVQDHWKQLCVTTQLTDLQRGVNATRVHLAREVTGVVNTCHDIGTQLYYTCTRVALEDKLHALCCIKVDDVRHCMENVVYDKCPVVVAVGPTENLPDYSRIRAGQYWLRL